MVTRKPIIDFKSYVDSQAYDPNPDANPGGSQGSAPGGSSSQTVQSTTTTTTQAPISSKVPAQFSASSYDELIPQLEQRMNEFKPLSEEELKKLRRKQKIEGIISGVADAAQAVSNLIFTHHYAPNMYNAKEGMSVKAKERFEKEKAQRDADADKYLQYALTIGKMKDADKDRAMKAWQTEQTLARQDRDHDDAVEFRNKDFDERVRQWQANFDRQGEWHQEEADRWTRQFNESVRQFNVSSANEKKRLENEGQRLALSLQQGQMTFNLGSGHGNVTLTLDKLNAQTVSRIYHTLPDSALYNTKTDENGNIDIDKINPKVKGDPIVHNGFVVGYKEPTTEAMLIAIGANVESCPATQNAIKQVAGLEKGEKPAGY